MTSMVLVSIWVASNNFEYESVTGYCAINCHLTVETWFYPRYCCGMWSMFLSRHFSLHIPFVIWPPLCTCLSYMCGTRGLCDNTVLRVSVWLHCCN
jgi:hypothetical protein